ncbi:MAG: hypothetical protein ACOYI2_09520 [Bacillota bacterium]
MRVIAILLFFSLIIVFQLPPLIRGKKWRELIVFMMLFLAGLGYSVGQVLDWPLPNPTKRLELLFEPAWKAIEKILS